MELYDYHNNLQNENDVKIFYNTMDKNESMFFFKIFSIVFSLVFSLVFSYCI